MEGVVNVEFHNSVITELIMRPSHSSTKPVWHATIMLTRVYIIGKRESILLHYGTVLQPFPGLMTFGVIYT